MNRVMKSLALIHLVSKFVRRCQTNKKRVIFRLLFLAEIDAATRNAMGRKILDYASDSSSDVETPTVSNTWRGQDLDNSDNESIDSQNEDPLK